MKFDLQIVLTEKTGKISVEAETFDEAKQIVQEQLNEGDIILDSETVEFLDQEIVEFKE
jgi:hypothetical protein